ncbi:Acyl-CoA dehydrogenase apdG (Aspyridones biosynthesis protein G) [Durusdinium trenchii]|uniref:Acyl-CoA dehydrogenase apdG (Aspyridones biosynthesis protein G) n=1 Tax=Durusdinium trenchii TaxID=1381693 RepID=A0ABP0RH24_9DINO
MEDPCSFIQDSCASDLQETHKAWRKRCRDFVEEHIIPYVSQWEVNKAVPKETYIQCAEAGLLPIVVGAHSGAFDLVPYDAPEGLDYFHELIFVDELARCGSGGVLWGLIEGLQIGLPPVLNFGSDEMKKRVAPDCLMGKKIISLNITEPNAGSDVAALKCTATKEGDFYIVNGNKKWITNGIFSDYFTCAVRTGAAGMRGVSMLLVERSEGLSTKRMDCQGVWPSGTTYVELDNVKVPAANLIGKENEGFKVIMKNFNHERWGFTVQANRLSRVLIEESWAFSNKRATFGKKLIEHPVIRWKLAEMTRQVEALHHWLENMTFQLCSWALIESCLRWAEPHLALSTLLWRAFVYSCQQSSRVMEYCAREARQIFGGNAYTRSGLGEKAERLYRDVGAYAIPGGSEEILLDLAIRQGNKSKL